MIYHLSPQGDDAADGLSHATAWQTLARLQRHILEAAGPGDRYALRAGQTFFGALALPHPFPVEVVAYDGDAPAIIQSGGESALSYYGTGGLTVRGLRLQGSSLNVNNAGIDIRPASSAAGITLLDVEASGYGLGGVVLSGSMSDVLIRQANLHHNANGLFVSGARVRGLRVEDTDADENNLPNESSTGNGMAIVWADDVEITNCRFRRNGNISGSGGGHSGLTIQECRRVRVRFCEASETSDPGPHGDGQSFVSNDSENVLFEFCQVMGGRIGFEVHDDGAAPSRNIAIRNCTATDCVVCFYVQKSQGGIWLTDNIAVTHMRDGVYRKALDIWDAGGPVGIRGNWFEAHDGAPLLEATDGLRHVYGLPDNGWRSNRPTFLVRGQGYTKIGDALAAEPVAV